MVKKIFISILFGIFIFVSLLANTSLAAVTVTKENLNEALQKFVESEENEENYKISVLEDEIEIEVNGEKYKLKYNLDGKPTFSLEVLIEEGMSYEEFIKKTDGLILPTLGYIAVANIQGVELKDASSYCLSTYLLEALNKGNLNKNSYVIIDDLNPPEGVTIEKTDDPKTIYTSEFGEKVMEYVNNTYNDKQEISDSNGINSYTFTIDKKEASNTSCKLVATISVNLDADFTKIQGYADKFGNSELKGEITKENADCEFTLIVGQKCNIITEEKITGYEFYGDCIEINEDYTQLTAKKAGVMNGYLILGDHKKSIYITVRENTENVIFSDATLEIKKTVEKNEYEVNIGNKTEVEYKEQTQTNNKAELEVLPKTGEKMSIIINILYAIVCVSVIAIITLVCISKKKK